MMRNKRFSPFIAALFAVAIGGHVAGLLAADTQPPRTEKQIEVIVIHVDKYGVYAPNLIFYWDPGMNKQKIAALTGIADQLRNKNAVITYATTSDITRDKRPLLVDIAPFKPETPPSGDSLLALEASRPSTAEGEKTAPVQPREQLKPESEVVVPPKPRSEAELGQTKEIPPRSQNISRAEVVNFIRNCIDAMQSKDIDRSLACYGSEVDYYSKGIVNKDFIRRDKGYYFRNWDKIRSSIDGDIVVIVIDQPDLRIAKFNSRFYVANAKNMVSGLAENVWKIRKGDGELKIVDEKQKIIERDSQ